MNTNETFKVGIYLRLSNEDIRDNDNKRDDESQSISNQRDFIMNYIIRNNLMLIDEYIDDGVSGYIMDRPDFDRLKMDLNTGKVDVVIVKDLSRLGRHNAKVQLFLENILEKRKDIFGICLKS